MAFTPEPTIDRGQNPEGTFHRAVKNEINVLLNNRIIAGNISNFIVLDKFGLDLGILFGKPLNPTSRFFELKAFVGSRPGGVGFGNQSGEGIQVELLLLQNQALSLANDFIRWLLVDGTKPKNSLRYYIFDNIQARLSAMAGIVRRGKQNNININQIMLSVNPLDWNGLSVAIDNFLT